MTAFSHIAFKAVWDSLPAATHDAIRSKAAWEHMTLSAVMQEWWPELWARVEGTTSGSTREVPR